MEASTLDLASDEERALILSQAERRLEFQNNFAAAADQRSSTVTGAATALAAAAAGLAVQSTSGGQITGLGIASGVAALGFTAAAIQAMRSARCLDFHPPGYLPQNFISDVQSRRRRKAVELDMMADLNDRIAFNSEKLVWRGNRIDEALFLMALTPVVALAVSVGWMVARSP